MPEFAVSGVGVTEFEHYLTASESLPVYLFIVIANEDFRLAFEYQLINAGGKGGAINFNNGLGTFPTDSTFTVANVRVDLGRRRVWVGEAEVHLTRTGYKLLTTLV